MFGPGLLVRTLNSPTRLDRYGNRWQYHSRSDHHSKVACWGIVLDLLSHCPLLAKHVASDRVHFGINHEMVDFRNDRKKKLDLVLCTSRTGTAPRSPLDLRLLAGHYEIALQDEERALLKELPALRSAPVGSVLMALEAKACMTAHQRALPRLYDELNSSHSTVHGASDQAIAAGFVMINVAQRYLSPDLNKQNRAEAPQWSAHRQPRDATLVMDKVRQIPRRSRPTEEGYDALGILLLECTNDGSPVRLVDAPPAPPPGDIYHYAALIDRLAHSYATRFKDL